MKLQKHAIIALHKAKEQAERHGAEVSIDGCTGGTHYRFVVRRGDTVHIKLPLSCSPKNPDDTIKAFLRDLRRRLSKVAY